MPNQRLATSPSSRAASDVLAFELSGGFKDLSSSRPSNGAPAKAGFSSVAPSEAPRGGGAETKLYQVPRELIEIARANAKNRKAAAVGTLTPIAPRPDAEVEASAKAYAAQVSESPAAPSDIHLLADVAPTSDGAAASSGTRLAIPSASASAAPISDPVAALEVEAERPAAEVRVEAERLDDGPAIETELAPEAEPAALAASGQEENAAEIDGIGSGRVWFYASVLVALGYCAQLALTW
jgi:hypothetical protein